MHIGQVSQVSQRTLEANTAIFVKLCAMYPALDLCMYLSRCHADRIDIGISTDAPVYPHNLEVIYPPKVGSSGKRLRAKRSFSSNSALSPHQPRARYASKHASLGTFATSSGIRSPEPVPPVPPLPENLHQLRPISPWTGLPKAEEPAPKCLSIEGFYNYPVICPCEFNDSISMK